MEPPDLFSDISQYESLPYSTIFVFYQFVTSTNKQDLIQKQKTVTKHLQKTKEYCAEKNAHMISIKQKELDELNNRIKIMDNKDIIINQKEISWGKQKDSLWAYMCNDLVCNIPDDVWSLIFSGITNSVWQIICLMVTCKKFQNVVNTMKFYFYKQFTVIGICISTIQPIFPYYIVYYMPNYNDETTKGKIYFYKKETHSFTYEQIEIMKKNIQLKKLISLILKEKYFYGQFMKLILFLIVKIRILWMIVGHIIKI